jgi:multicomponent Na+:H+ antiporter subunit E
MSMFLFNILLAVTWGMATGTFTVSNLAFGFALGYLILWSAQRVMGPSPYFARVSVVLRFALRYLWDLVVANFRVAYDVVVPGAWPDPSSWRSRMAFDGSPVRPAGAAGGASPSIRDSLRAPIAAESYICPGVIGIPLDARTDAEITLLANLITLTPGSVSLDLSEDRSVLYVHAMYIDGGDVEAYRRSVKEGLERRVLELLR